MVLLADAAGDFFAMVADVARVDAFVVATPVWVARVVVVDGFFTGARAASAFLARLIASASSVLVEAFAEILSSLSLLKSSFGLRCNVFASSCTRIR